MRYLLVIHNPGYKAQKTKGILNVFGVYDYTNDQMWTHGYKAKTGGKQFLDFIKRE
jgi:hypothetical protein